MSSIASALLEILRAPKHYTINSPKTTTGMLAMWAVQNIRLPSDVVAPLADNIVDALRRGIDCKLRKEGKKGAGCKALTVSLTSPSLEQVLTAGRASKEASVGRTRTRRAGARSLGWMAILAWMAAMLVSWKRETR